MKNFMHSYPKVWAIGHRNVLELFDGEVFIEEKVDGSQFSFTKIDGEVYMRSKGAEVHMGEGGMFSKAAVTVETLKSLLNEGWTYRCEYLQKPKHNALTYSRVPKGHLIVFDINTGDEQYLGYAEKVLEAARLGLEVVPLIWRGTIQSPTEIYQLLERESVLGGAKIEGVVVKNYAKFGEDKKVLMGKYVSEAFKEIHTNEWKKSNPTRTDILEALGQELRSEARWQKAVQHLRDEGKLDESPRDIGNLIKAVQSDIRAEAIDYISKRLLDYALPHLLRKSTAGLPEWYKQQLLESAFEDKQAV